MNKLLPLLFISFFATSTLADTQLPSGGNVFPSPSSAPFNAAAAGIITGTCPTVNGIAYFSAAQVLTCNAALTTDGSGRIRTADGTSVAPAYSFTSDTTIGIYKGADPNFATDALILTGGDLADILIGAPTVHGTAGPDFITISGATIVNAANTIANQMQDVTLNSIQEEWCNADATGCGLTIVNADGVDSGAKNIDMVETVNSFAGIHLVNLSNGANATAEIRMGHTSTTAADYNAVGYAPPGATVFAGRAYMTSGTGAAGMSINIGTGDLRWTTGSPPADTERMRLTTTGLGIGTAQSPSANPTQKLDIFDTTLARIFNRSDTNAQLQMEAAGGNPADIILDGYRGSIAVPTATQSGDTEGDIFFGGYTGTTTSSRANLAAVATENWSNTNKGTKFNFSIVKNGTQVATRALTIDQSSFIGMGVNAPASPASDLVIEHDFNGNVELDVINTTNGTASSGFIHTSIGGGQAYFGSYANAFTAGSDPTAFAGWGSFEAAAGTNGLLIYDQTGAFKIIHNDNAPNRQDFGIDSAGVITIGGVGGLTSSGTMEGRQTTSGTTFTWRVPTGIAASGITLPTCSTSADAGRIFYSDDSDDASDGTLCTCRANAAGTYANVMVSDNSTACPDP